MVPPMPFIAAANAGASIVPLTLTAINAYLRQPVKDAVLERALQDFHKKIKRLDSTLDEIKEARPMVEKHKWEIVLQLDEAVEEAAADVKEELENLKNAKKQGTTGC